MKITDLALIFIAISLPIIIVVYVNVSYTIKAEEQEIYYKKIINSAVNDAANQMKEVESNDPEIDYGYSGTQNNKVSINADIAINTFFKSLYNNFGIIGNDAAEHFLQTFVPAVAIIDYNGVYISSQENYSDNGVQKIEHVLKPKKYYTYSYYIDNSGNFNEGLPSNTNGYKSVHTVEFTMDDYITHRGYSTNFGQYDVKSFYISDYKNNFQLFDGSAPNSDSNELKKIVEKLTNVRKQVIIDTIVKEMSYAVNNANAYARNAGINYDFVFPTTTVEEMENAIENVGMFAFVQGISVGNKYLNAKSYSVAKLENTTRYYFSVCDDSPSTKSIYYNAKINLYHKSKNCPEYTSVMGENVDDLKITPAYVFTKQQAASATVSTPSNKKYVGFYPCPVCKP